MGNINIKIQQIKFISIAGLCSTYTCIRD